MCHWKDLLHDFTSVTKSGVQQQVNQGPAGMGARSQWARRVPASWELLLTPACAQLAAGSSLFLSTIHWRPRDRWMSGKDMKGDWEKPSIFLWLNIFPAHAWDLSFLAGFNPATHLALGNWSFNHWTTSEVPAKHLGSGYVWKARSSPTVCTIWAGRRAWLLICRMGWPGPPSSC